MTGESSGNVRFPEPLALLHQSRFPQIIWLLFRDVGGEAERAAFMEGWGVPGDCFLCSTGVDYHDPRPASSTTVSLVERLFDGSEDTPAKSDVFIGESARELRDYLVDLPPLQREPVFRTVYKGRWTQWSCTIVTIVRKDTGYRLSCSEPTSYLLRLFEAGFSAEHNVALESLSEGDSVSVTGLLTHDLDGFFFLSRCYFDRAATGAGA